MLTRRFEFSARAQSTTTRSLGQDKPTTADGDEKNSLVNALSEDNPACRCRAKTSLRVDAELKLICSGATALSVSLVLRSSPSLHLPSLTSLGSVHRHRVTVHASARLSLIVLLLGARLRACNCRAVAHGALIHAQPHTRRNADAPLHDPRPRAPTHRLRRRPSPPSRAIRARPRRRAICLAAVSEARVYTSLGSRPRGTTAAGAVVRISQTPLRMHWTKIRHKLGTASAPSESVVGFTTEASSRVPPARVDSVAGRRQGRR